MHLSSDRQVAMCPYCGSTDLLIESDEVKLERIRSQAYVDVESSRARTEREVAKTRNISDAIVFGSYAVMMIALIIAFAVAMIFK